jgi:hypothetical protein
VVADGEDNNPQRRQIPLNKSFHAKTAKGQREPSSFASSFFLRLRVQNFYEKHLLLKQFSRKDGRRAKRSCNTLLLCLPCVLACKKAGADRNINQSKPSRMEILVFKTDVRSRKRVTSLAPHLENMKGITKWNVDLQDVDKVLRVECASISPDTIEKIVRQAGYYCKELTD